MSVTKFHAATVVEKQLEPVVKEYLKQIPGGKVVDVHTSTFEEVANTVSNGYVLAKFHEANDIYITIVFEYAISDPNDFVADLLSPIKYMAM